MLGERSKREVRATKLRMDWLKDAKARMHDYNSEEALLAWANQAVAKLPAMEQLTLLAVARDEIKKGGWRGDVSHRWITRGYTMVDIPDMYP